MAKRASFAKKASAKKPVGNRRAKSSVCKAAATATKRKGPAAPVKGPVVEAPDAKRKPPKCPLSRKELAEFRDMLLEKRKTLLGDMNGMQAEALRASRQDGSGDLSSMPVHMADIGTDNYEQEFTLGLLESERQLLREIDEALERVANGTYGICVGTDEIISKARLRAKPWAKYSIEYARKIEQGLVRRPGSGAGPVAEEEDEEEDREVIETEFEVETPEAETPGDEDEDLP